MGFWQKGTIVYTRIFLENVHATKFKNQPYILRQHEPPLQNTEKTHTEVRYLNA